jgi:hypothetical protein
MIDLLFPVALATIAILYSAVGHAGGTGYVALMGLAGFAPAVIKPTALSLNVLVSAIGCAAPDNPPFLGSLLAKLCFAKSQLRSPLMGITQQRLIDQNNAARDYEQALTQLTRLMQRFDEFAHGCAGFG